ncbi:DUF5329 family protein [Pontibacter sp. SGAir0037]|uniref:DUF5329 family protein n=1 Tax=Pontibacter sp. SGAir0037 TaxID=2571030 RepID=UPI0010CCEDDD|nr:DUF5329 family protein [Pontibacter sp. SGAir0037]QCR24529.1 hypothetical protein C1N53_20660 [Pontibacter sp. SGAir0037]
MFKKLILGLALATAFSVYAPTTLAQSGPQATASTTALSEDQKINKLIAYIRNLEGATFIRNGSEHSPAEAADHLQAKYKKHAKRVTTAEIFIEQLASKSSMSGEVYKIKMPNGSVTEAGKVLRAELQRLSQASAGN